jgi:DNA-binding NarL/FixJ family response regulator
MTAGTRTSDAVGQPPDPAAAVMVVDDHELVGSLIVMGLRDCGIRAHRCPVTSIEEIMKVADRIGLGLALLDLDLGFGSNGEFIDELLLIRGLTSRGWRTVIVSGVTDDRRVAAAIAAGAVGYLSKTVPLDRLLAIVTEVASGRPALTPEEVASWQRIHRVATAQARERQRRLNRLTHREREILGLLAQGERAACIAQAAVVSLTTVRSQIRSILTKLEVNSQLEAVALLRDGH